MVLFWGISFLTPVPAFSQNSSGQHMDTGSAEMLQSADVKFADNAARGGIAEVEMGQLAAEKGSNQGVKAFGQQMVDDHTKANAKLKRIADSESMTLPTDLTSKDQELKSKLQNLSGAQFDGAYIKAMVKDHQEDVKEFKKEANSGKDPKIKEFASQTLPILQDHLAKAKSAQAALAGKSVK